MSVECVACMYYMRYKNQGIIKSGVRVRQRLEVKIFSWFEF